MLPALEGVFGDRADERRHLLRDSGAVPVPPVDLAARGRSSPPEPPPAATALILYTSGITGPRRAR